MWPRAWGVAFGDVFSRVFAVCPCCFADLRGHTLYGIFAGVWKVELEPIADWLNTLDHKSRVQILAAVSLLEEQGPDLKRPIVGKIKGSSLIPSMKELRRYWRKDGTIISA